LAAGHYKIHLEREAELFVAQVDLGLEDLLVLGPDHFETSERTPAVARGGAGSWPPRPGFMGPLVGRSRIRLIVGKNDSGLGGDIPQSGLVSTRANTNDLVLGLGYSRWIREDLSVGVDLLLMEGDYVADVGMAVTSQASGLISLRVGVQKYMPTSLLRTPIRPFVSLGLGALIGSEEKTEIAGAQLSESALTMGAFGSELGLGVDFILARPLMLGARTSYILATDFPEPLAGKKNYSGLEFVVSVSWLFGRGFEG
jgi:hypothetical protein